ncbi:hypothetical protein ElyMa_004467500 [Elysia marginata]|uniref:Uncharacterized protein n=1 Tax=Elysia marginata TaxID=1093978 RepID=A0AAV4HHE0_9GAST|nr:hypothetical protein ElyMa_004467500 [Elysia marginata]
MRKPRVRLGSIELQPGFLQSQTLLLRTRGYMGVPSSLAWLGLGGAASTDRYARSTCTSRLKNESLQGLILHRGPPSRCLGPSSSTLCTLPPPPPLPPSPLARYPPLQLPGSQGRRPPPCESLLTVPALRRRPLHATLVSRLTSMRATHQVTGEKYSVTISVRIRRECKTVDYHEENF